MARRGRRGACTGGPCTRAAGSARALVARRAARATLDSLSLVPEPRRVAPSRRSTHPRPRRAIAREHRGRFRLETSTTFAARRLDRCFFLPQASRKGALVRPGNNKLDRAAMGIRPTPAFGTSACNTTSSARASCCFRRARGQRSGDRSDPTTPAVRRVERATINRTTTLGGLCAERGLEPTTPLVHHHRSRPLDVRRDDQSDRVGPAQRLDDLRGLGDVRFIVSYQGLVEEQRPQSVQKAQSMKAPAGRYGGPRRRHRDRRPTPDRASRRGQSRRTRRPTTWSTPACSPAPAAPTSSSAPTTTASSPTTQCVRERTVPGDARAPPRPARPGLSPRQHDDLDRLRHARPKRD